MGPSYCTAAGERQLSPRPSQWMETASLVEGCGEPENVSVGSTRKWRRLPVGSVLPPTTDIRRSSKHVRFVPRTDSCSAKMHPRSISSARSRSANIMIRPRGVSCSEIHNELERVGCSTGRSTARAFQDANNIRSGPKNEHRQARNNMRPSTFR
jgi:hypothetical protein